MVAGIVSYPYASTMDKKRSVEGSNGPTANTLTETEMEELLWVILTALSVARLYSVGWYDDRLIGRHLEGRTRGLIEALSRHLPGGTEEIHENPQSGYPVSRPRFEPRTSRIRIKSVAAMPTRSVDLLCSVITRVKLTRHL
jgi:hypothetical protein